MEILDIPIDDINEGERFRKDYGDENDWFSFVENIKQYGILQPITCNESLTLMAGGRRLRAAKECKLETVPVIIRKGTTEADLREVELIENIHRKDLTWQEKVALEAEVAQHYDTQTEAAEVLGVHDSTLSVDLQVANMMEVMPDIAKLPSITDARKVLKRMQERAAVEELRRRHQTSAERSQDAVSEAISGGEDTSPEAEPTMSKRARLFQLGDNHYKVGDALEGLKSLHPLSFGFIECDPPYGIDLHDLKRNEGSKAGTVSTYKEISGDEYADFMYALLDECYRVLNHNTFAIVWFAWKHFAMVKDAAEAAGFDVYDIPGIWSKGKQGQTQNPSANLASCHEPFFICRKGKPMLAKQGRSNIFEYTPVLGSSKDHATQRPLPLMEDILETFCWPGQTVVSPFLGSGTTIIAAYNKDLVAFGWDMEQAHKDSFLLRLQEEEFKEKEDDV